MIEGTLGTAMKSNNPNDIISAIQSFGPGVYFFSGERKRISSIQVFRRPDLGLAIHESDRWESVESSFFAHYIEGLTIVGVVMLDTLKENHKALYYTDLTDYLERLKVLDELTQLWSKDYDSNGTEIVSEGSD
jgi:hypothetical protein